MVIHNDFQFKTSLPEFGNEARLKTKIPLNFVEWMNPHMIL